MARPTGRARRWLLDALPSLPFAVFGLLATQPAAQNQPSTARAVDGFGYALVVLAALALALRRRPGLSLALNGAAIVTYLAAGYPFGPILLTVPVAIYAVAVRWPLRRAAGVVTGHLAVILGAAFVKMAREPAGATGPEVFWLTLAWGAIAAAALAVGAALRVRRDSVARVRAEQAHRVASDERLRMAQDLHDTIGHALAAIAMQAGVALHVLDRSPEQAREAMEAVRATSRESLENLRAELDALRRPEAARRRPTPGLDDLPRLAERVRAGGVTVRVDIDPDLPALPAAVDAAAYRILQESLTNVLRHAGTTAARISIASADGALLVNVVDAGGNGVVTGSGEGGSGIDGMRAQAEALGGTLHAGPRPAGGFAVTARLPMGAQR